MALVYGSSNWLLSCCIDMDFFKENKYAVCSHDTIKNYSKFIHHIRLFKKDDVYKVMFCNDNYFWMSLKRHGHNEYGRIKLF